MKEMVRRYLYEGSAPVTSGLTSRRIAAHSLHRTGVDNLRSRLRPLARLSARNVSAYYALGLRSSLRNKI